MKSSLSLRGILCQVNALERVKLNEKKIANEWTSLEGREGDSYIKAD